MPHTLAPFEPSGTPERDEGDLVPVTTRELSRDTAAVIERVERGQGFLVTRRGRPVARVLPIERVVGGLTPEQEAALARFTAAALALPPSGAAPTRFDRQELYDERDDELAARRERHRGR